MMKYLYVLLISACFTCRGIAQEIKAPAAGDASVLNDYELTDKQYSSWKVILNTWKGEDLEKIKFENKVNMNCKTCESFYIEVVLKINGSGKLEYYKLIDGKNCRISVSKQLELRMMRNFFKFEYPVELRNITFKTRLGDVLKC